MDHGPDSRIFVRVERQNLTDYEEQATDGFVLDPDCFGSSDQDGPAWKRETAILAALTIREPTVIFGNLQRENYDDACCYCAPVDQIIDNDGSQFAPDTSYVVLAFGALVGNELVFFDWEYRLEHPAQRGYPVNSRNDFGDPLWPTQPQGEQWRKR